MQLRDILKPDTDFRQADASPILSASPDSACSQSRLSPVQLLLDAVSFVGGPPRRSGSDREFAFNSSSLS